jgi:predicted lysophospholipase L1 biosynthesis ABC-type transport system permease subunit
MVADRLWPDRSAIGRVVAMDDMEVLELTVVGVIDGIRHWALDREPAADIYVPFASVAEWHLGRLDIAIRYQASADLITGALRSIMQSVDPEQPIERITSMESRIASSAATPRTQTALLATFALFAFLLAAAGLYGSMLYIVGMRRRELGIRMALGARHGDVVRHIVQHGARLIALGTLLGLATALSAIRLLQNYVFEVSPADPLSILLAIAALSTIGLLACWLPARRAARTDPLVTLRHG